MIESAAQRMNAPDVARTPAASLKVQADVA